MDGAMTGTAAGNRAARQAAMAAAPQVCAPEFAKPVTAVTKDVTVNAKYVAVAAKPFSLDPLDFCRSIRFAAAAGAACLRFFQRRLCF